MTQYTHFKARLAMLFGMLLSCICTFAQFKATVVDAQTGEPIPYATARYEGSTLAARCDADGVLTIPMKAGLDQLTFTCIGYKKQTVTVNNAIARQNATVKLYADELMIGEVVVKARHERYRRKDNPAVELMRRVIATKEKNGLSTLEAYKMDKYSKHVVAFNDVTPKTFQRGLLKRFSFLKDHAESCPETGKLIVPLIVSEKTSEEYYSRRNGGRRSVVTGEHSDGVNTLFSIGDFVTTYVKDIFTDIDIYQNNCRVLQHPFISPVSSTEAIAFYHYFIADTVMVEGQRCVSIQFRPANVQDFGFSGNLYVTVDPDPVIRRCVLNIHKHTGVNFIENLIVTQDFELQPNGINALRKDNMIVELRYTEDMIKFHAQRLSVYNNIDLAYDPSAKPAKVTPRSDEQFISQHRPVALSETEASIGRLMTNTKGMGGFDIVMIIFKALIENSIELTSQPSKFDLVPLNTLYSNNYVDGSRFRLGGQTTANLNPHLFWRGYAAYGTKDKKWKYQCELEYSFNKKKYAPHEFPRRSIVASYLYDDMSPVDQFSGTDKDNMYTSVKASKVEHMMYVRSQTLQFNYETDGHFLTQLGLTHSRLTPAGKMVYARNQDGTLLPHIDQSLLRLQLRWAPGEETGNSKQRRLPINHDAPVFTLEHQHSSKGFLGSDYTSNITEASIYKRFWLPQSMGNFDVYLKGGVQWNKVPFNYLFIPSSNLSYIIQFDNWSFCMLDNMEFLNDRYVSLFAHWNLDGKLLNRVPLIRKLKLREYIGFKMLYGHLSDRNNPYASPNDNFLLRFPDDNGRQTTFVMGQRPYMELSVGIANIFKFLTVQYVRRLNYLDQPGMNTKKNGVRFAVDITF